MTEHVDGRRYPHDVHNKARVYTLGGQEWVTHEELLDCGYRNISDFDIVYLNGKFYELQGHLKKANSWWIEEIDIGEEEETKAEPNTQKTAESE